MALSLKSYRNRSMMFIWSVEKLKIDLISYECEAEGLVEELLDRTSSFKKMVLRPRIEVRNCVREKVQRALELAEKYSLIVQSIKAAVVIEPEIRFSGRLMIYQIEMEQRIETKIKQ